MGADVGLPPLRRTGRPYPEAFDDVPYPIGYTVPNFKSFTGEGPKTISPDQHIAHFQTTCGNTAVSDALLLRQFPQSLAGPAFEWYYSLENGSIKSWNEMADAFGAKFTVASDRVGIADLANPKPRRGEAILDYINRWRNLSIRCDRPVEQFEAVELLLKNIDNWMTPFLSMANITTFQALITHVSRLEHSNQQSWLAFQNYRGRPRQIDIKKAETKVVVNSDTSSPNRPRYNYGGGGYRPQGSSFEEKKRKPYSFRRDKVMRIFRGAIKNGLKLPESKRPDQADCSDKPNYCPYHRVLGHTIEDCYVFKDWVERTYRAGEITLQEDVLQDPAPHESANVVSTSIDHELHATNEEDSSGWAVHLTRGTRRIFKKAITDIGKADQVTSGVRKSPQTIRNKGKKVWRKVEKRSKEK